ncbi:MAG: hypothetical protein ABSF26_19685 [Thermoguttaceae bacterium]|jgi:hypothetical protein
MALSLMQAIHCRWSAVEPLCALLPGGRLATGLSPDPGLPRAVVSLQSDRPLAACNDGSTVRLIGLRFQVFHGNYDAAAAIVEQIDAAFDRTDFDLDDGQRVIEMRRTGGGQRQQDDGVWQMNIDFVCMVHIFKEKIA